MRSVGLFILLSLMTGCVSDPPTAPGRPLDVEIVLGPGDITTIDGTSFRLRFEGVMGDSRCPADAFCIQGGDALVRISVYASRGPLTTYDLHTGNLRPIRHEDLTVALKELSPYPFSAHPIAPGDYRATIRVTR